MHACDFRKSLCARHLGHWHGYTFPYSSAHGSAAQFNGSVSAMPAEIPFEFGRLRIRARRIHCYRLAYSVRAVNVGSDEVYFEGERVVIHASERMDWPVREFCKVPILFQGRKYYLRST